ncbi:MAG: cell division protein SepF [Clostridia bacterium]|nr:cell division protein SepF [Clostridia bacterium]
MANVVVNKILDFLGVDNGEIEDEEELLDNENYGYDQMEVDEPEEDRGIFSGRRKGNKVVSMPQQQIKMKIAKPTAFEQAEDICILLREKNAIVINLEYVNKDVARRILDVISGAVKVLDGHFEKVSNSIFIVAPFNYDIVNDMTREEIKNKLSVSWLK